ncbi:MAG: DUF2442 domain-containing protein [Clostridia bacterium]|nr:DUF2442 domain-containing protein [Clostridia bacterium]
MNNPAWVVKDVKPQKDYILLITFEDGSKKKYDARPLLQKELFSKLNNISFFMQAKAQYGTVTWDDDTDIAPEHLYEVSVPA